METTTAIESDLADLRGTTLDRLCLAALGDDLQPYRHLLISQVERPRPNVGTGPPVRAD
jgi:hypothetical protein